MWLPITSVQSIVCRIDGQSFEVKVKPFKGNRISMVSKVYDKVHVPAVITMRKPSGNQKGGAGFGATIGFVPPVQGWSMRARLRTRLHARRGRRRWLPDGDIA